MQIREIVVPVDFSDCSKAALRRASSIAERTGAHLHLLHAVPPIPYPAPVEFGIPTAVTEEIETGARAKLAEWAAELETEGRSVSHETVLRAPVDVIGDTARSRNADLIVMGTHGHTGLKHLLLGSVAERTLRTAPCPVLTVKEHFPAGAFERILLCTDFSDHAERAAAVAIKWAEALDAELHVAHAVTPAVPVYAELPPPPEYLGQVREAARHQLETVQRRVEDAGLACTAHLLEGEAAGAVAELAERREVDMVVVGTRGRSGLKHVVLGSVAERVARLVPCPVLVVGDAAG